MAAGEKHVLNTERLSFTIIYKYTKIIEFFQE